MKNEGILQLDYLYVIYSRLSELSAIIDEV